MVFTLRHRRHVGAWWTRTKVLSLATFVRLPAIVHYIMVICVSADWLQTLWRVFKIWEKWTTSFLSNNYWLTRISQSSNCFFYLKTAQSWAHISKMIINCQTVVLNKDPIKVFDSFSELLNPYPTRKSYQRISRLVSVLYITGKLVKHYKYK